MRAALLLRRRGARCLATTNARAAVSAPSPAATRVHMPVYTHSDYTLALPDVHSFPMERYAKVSASMHGVRARGLGIAVRHDPVPATLEQVARAHDAEFVRAFARRDGLSPRQIRTIGFPWSYELVRRTFRITGATIAATDDVLLNQFPAAGNLAGGTHHAFRAHGEGYCIFNDIAVAARHAQEIYGVGRVAVIDLDVHQGNGTAEIFQNDNSVFTWSVHGEKNYPWKTRVLGDLDTGLPDDISGDDFLAAVEAGLERLSEEGPFDLVFYQAGVDALAEDRLGRLSLRPDDLQARNALVYSWAAAEGVPVVVTMGGGYSRPIEHSVAAHVDVLCQAASMLCSSDDKVPPSVPST